MSHAFRIDPTPSTIADLEAFLEFDTSDRPWELIDGEIVGMTNPSSFHAKIVANLGVPLSLAMETRGCQVVFGGLRVQRSDDRGDSDSPIPDLLVRCGPVTRGYYVTDPLVVVEVLSPLTMDYDRGAKLLFYKSLPTLRHVVLVYQDELRAEHYRRDGDAWPETTLVRAGDQLALDAVEFFIPVGAIYVGLEAIPAA